MRARFEAAGWGPGLRMEMNRVALRHTSWTTSIVRHVQQVSPFTRCFPHSEERSNSDGRPVSQMPYIGLAIHGRNCGNGDDNG